MRMQRRIGCAAVIAMATGLGAAGPRQAAQVPPRTYPSTAAAKPAQTSSDSFELTPIVSETRTSLFVIGDAIAPAIEQARQNSREDAVVRTATEVNRRLFADPDAQLSISFATLRDYVRRVTRVVGTRAITLPSSVRVYTRLEMNKAFIDPARIGTLAQPGERPARNTVVGYLLVPSDRQALPYKGSGIVRRVQAKAAAARDGSFFFTFVGRETANRGLALRLMQIEVDQDGSPGRAGWRFDIYLNTRVVIRLPAASYDNDVRRYPLPADDPGLEFSVSGDDPNIEIRIIGQRTEARG
jgi:hypothetical protein